ncbi:MAG: hypothetical protein Q8R28_22250 [Dehalococcoidia bacterium]|nr:hypothetical protein [Dehalococcoidia bacterium]
MAKKRQNFTEGLFLSNAAKTTPSVKRRDDAWIEDLVGVFVDPIIVYPSGWEDTTPKRLKEAVTMQRLLQNVRLAKGLEQPGFATDAEALATAIIAWKRAQRRYPTDGTDSEDRDD